MFWIHMPVADVTRPQKNGPYVSSRASWHPVRAAKVSIESTSSVCPPVEVPRLSWRSSVMRA